MSAELQLLDKATGSALPDLVTDMVSHAPCGSNAGNRVVIKFSHGGRRHGAGRKPTVPEPPADPRWYCVRTAYGQDLRADIEIRWRGFEVFSPTIWKPPVLARRLPNGALRPARDAAIKPLFPRYVFARFTLAEPGWQVIRGLPGVDAILSSTPERPTPVPESALDAVRSLCAPNGCVYPPGWEFDQLVPVQQPLAVGCRVRVLAGPLADHVGVCQMSDGKRVRLLLEILGREVGVKVDQCDVEMTA